MITFEQNLQIDYFKSNLEVLSNKLIIRKNVEGIRLLIVLL